MSGIDQSIRIVDLDKDCDQFPWSEIRMIYTNFHEVQLQPWSHNSTVVNNQKTLLTFTFIHFGQPPQHKGKKPMLLFSVVKNFIFILWFKSDGHFSIVRKNHPTY